MENKINEDSPCADDKQCPAGYTCQNESCSPNCGSEACIAPNVCCFSNNKSFCCSSQKTCCYETCCPTGTECLGTDESNTPICATKCANGNYPRNLNYCNPGEFCINGECAGISCNGTFCDPRNSICCSSQMYKPTCCSTNGFYCDEEYGCSLST